MRFLLILVLVAGSARATAERHGSVRGKVVIGRMSDVEAKPALVYVTGFTEPAPSDAVVIEQRGKRFQPALVAITAGQSISFPNGDPFLHNVFSSSDGRKFELGSYPAGESRSRMFPKPGVVDVYCNIHPEMSATILVLPNRKFTFTASDGSFAIDDLPPGKWTIFAYSRRAKAPARAEIDVVAGATTTVELELTEQRRSFDHDNKFGEKYRDPERYR